MKKILMLAIITTMTASAIADDSITLQVWNTTDSAIYVEPTQDSFRVASVEPGGMVYIAPNQFYEFTITVANSVIDVLDYQMFNLFSYDNDKHKSTPLIHPFLWKHNYAFEHHYELCENEISSTGWCSLVYARDGDKQGLLSNVGLDNHRTNIQWDGKW